MIKKQLYSETFTMREQLRSSFDTGGRDSMQYFFACVLHTAAPNTHPKSRPPELKPRLMKSIELGLCNIDGFHGAWLHFRRARLGVCV